jgi:transcriptional/translational regulatory protein YebC/TACO1
VTGEKEDFGSIQAKLEEMGITPEEASLERIPNNRKDIDDDTFEQVMKLIDVIESDDDVVQVYHNMDVE